MTDTLRVMNGYTVVASCTPADEPGGRDRAAPAQHTQDVGQRLTADAVDGPGEPWGAEHAIGAVPDRVTTDHVVLRRALRGRRTPTTCPSSR